MSARLYSLVVLINCILPFLILFGAAVFFNSLWNTVQTRLEPPVIQLINDAEALAEHARTAAKTVTASSELIKAEAKNAAASLTALIGPLTSFNIDIPSVYVPIFKFGNCKLDIREKGINIASCFKKLDVLGDLSRKINAGLKKAFEEPRAEFAKISASIDRALSEVNKLAPLAEAFRAQAREFSHRAEVLNEARQSIQAEVSATMKLAFWGLGAFGIWIGFSYLIWVWSKVARHWRILAHGV